MHLFLRILILFPLLSSGTCYGQQLNKEVRSKGYLLIASHEEILFYPDSTASAELNLSKLENITGIRVIGNSSYNYDIYRISRIVKPIFCKVTFYGESGSKTVDYSFQIIAVEATLTHLPGLQGKESGFAFEKDGRKYLFKYSDNFDYLLNKIVPISQSKKELFDNFNE